MCMSPAPGRTALERRGRVVGEFVVMPSRRCYFHPKRRTSLFALPRDAGLREQWLKFIFNSVPEKYNLNIAVCAAHFTEDSFLNINEFNAGFAQKLVLKDGAVPTLKTEAAVYGPQPVSTHEDLARVHHVACQTDPPKLCTVATQLSITTLRPHFRSTGVQATMPCPDVDVGTSEPQLSSAPIKMPRLELKEEEEDQESHWVLQMIV
ncbi:uncharacterized protein LOC131538118 [Onychostoma macrolepis]|uniref:uncharacterized protein LOC131538118 n=1 Tax=Onychostoma macrolepis TaxID=369639 RepID=UPI00272CE75D|nr:uncharacterized protein LOC131538118 [Onychostoma macrolepis]